MKELINPPLKEVVAEVYWKLGKGVDGQEYDPDFTSSVGIVARKIKHKFPYKVLKFPEFIRVPNAPKFQYFESENSESSKQLIQHGEGLLAVNDRDKNYSWDNFRETLNLGLQAIDDGYSSKIEITRLSILYVDSVEKNEENAFSFIKNNLKTEINLTFPHPGDLQDILFSSKFLNKDKGIEIKYDVFSNHASNNNSKDSIVWNTRVSKNNIIANELLDLKDVLSQFDELHEVSSKFFKENCSEMFYASFK